MSGLAGGTPIGDLGFRSVQRSCRKRRKSRRLGDGAEWVKPARSGPRTVSIALAGTLAALWLAAPVAAGESAASADTSSGQWKRTNTISRLRSAVHARRSATSNPSGSARSFRAWLNGA